MHATKEITILSSYGPTLAHELTGVGCFETDRASMACDLAKVQVLNEFLKDRQFPSVTLVRQLPMDLGPPPLPIFGYLDGTLAFPNSIFTFLSQLFYLFGIPLIEPLKR